MALAYTQCYRGQGVSPRQVSSWSIQLFGHNTPTPETDRTDNGPIFLQTVAQKRFHQIRYSIFIASAIY